MKVRLNKRTIDEATYQGPGGHYLWDTEMAGFGVRIYPCPSPLFVYANEIKSLQSIEQDALIWLDALGQAVKH